MDFPPFTTDLKNGTSVLIREVTKDDRHLLEVGFEHLSSRAKYFRFLGAHNDLTEKELDTFTATNTPDHVAVGAVLIGTAEPEPVGIARYIRLPDQPHVAEIAITISDSYQHLGLGSLLLSVLGKFAQEGGITAFNALVHSENAAMRGLLDHFDCAQSSHVGPEMNIRFPVVPGPDQPVAKAWQKTQKFKGLSKPVSVWEDDGGAILKLFPVQQ
ncbi:RimJ/RimL family protein N-acetyltransferase [Yoonia maritima]|uniref:RimJ/RimL family protein N-acetyltransferase n=1 Tax=Yoonia maritima TaxID=1435347 RepID=A0A2T0W555_9RHOB|nr:GNAT family N-acetyltransferase [Yoonia maritima]PRY80521.1 RimJ/RimL family protein N-acetyltransferase [Yoonia maritima]